MAEISKQALKVDNQTSFPTNNAGAITPTILRDFNINMIDSNVNQIQYTADSGSWNSSIALINAFTSSISASTDLTPLQIATASLQVASASLQVASASLQSFTSSATIRLNNLESTTASLNNSITNINSTTASLNVSITNLNSTTASLNTSISNLNSTTASFAASLTNINSFTSSQQTYNTNNDTKWSTLGGQSGSWVTESETSSFARTNATNTFTADQIISGGLDVTGTITAREIHTIIESSSVIFSTGSNILGDALTDVQTLSGSVRIVGSGTINGNTIVDSSLTSSMLVTASFATNNITFTKGDASTFHIDGFATTGSNTFVGDQTIYKSEGKLLFQSGSSNTAGVKMTAAGNLQLEVQSTQIGLLEQNAVTLQKNTTINGNLVANKLSAFNFDSLYLGSQLGGTTANGTFFGYGSTDYQFIIGAYQLGFDNELKITTNNNGIEFGDFNGSSYPSWLKLDSNTGSNPSPAFTRGLGITGSLIVSASSGTGAPIATFNSRVLVAGPTTGNTPYVQISGSDANSLLRRFSNAIDSTASPSANPSTTMYGHASASVSIGQGVYHPTNFDNIGELLITTTKNGTIFQDIKEGGDYGYNTWLTIPKNTNNNPAPQFNRGLTSTGSVLLSGSLTITGSAYGNIVPLSVSSNTASMDLSKGNFFTLTLPVGTTTELAATNIKQGQTVNILISQDGAGTGSISYNSTFKFNTPYTPTLTAGAKDIVTLVTFDNSIIYATSVKNLV